MTPLLDLAGVELRRFRRSRLTRAAILALLAVPLLYGALYLWAFWDPYGKLSAVPVALVDDDRPVTVAGRTVHAGLDLERTLVERGGFGWHVTDARGAADGLDSGRYYLAVTVPATFSADLTSPAGDDPRPAVLDVRTDDANGYLAGQLSRSVLAEIRSAVASSAIKDYLTNVYVSLATLHDQLGQAAQAAQQLATGAGSAKAGAQQLATGTARLARGADQLATGANTAAAGAVTLSRGASTLAGGLDRLDAGAAALPAQTRALAAGAAQVGAGTDRVAAVGAQVTVAAGTIDAARADLRARLLTEITAYAAAHPGDPQAQQLATDATNRLNLLDARLTAAGGRLRAAAARTTALAAGAHRVAGGAAALAAAAPTLSNGIHAADTGAHRLSGGASSLAAGTGRLATGATALDAGARQAAQGARSLSAGLVKLDDGAARLADGLATGAAKVPSYTGAAAAERAGVVADPVRLHADPINTAPTYGTGFAPYFIPLAIWVGAMVTFMLLRPLAPRSLASSAIAARIAAAGWLPAAAIGVVQALGLIAVLHWAIGLDARHPAGLVAFLIVVALSFTALLQWISAQFGTPGRLIALVLLMLQLTSAGGTYPIETAPAFFRWLHPLLPMSYVVTGLRHLISGGPAGAVWRSAAVLAGFGVAALVLTTLAARRQRVWTLARLHPELTL
jgi:putative membrane protein